MAYQSSRGGHDGSRDYDRVDALDAAQQRKEEREQASKKALKTGAKAAGAYFGGAAGAKAVDLASKTKAGDKLLNQGGKVLNKMPGVGRAADKLNKSGALDVADKGLDLASGGKNPGGSLGGGQNSSLPSSRSGAPRPQASNTPMQPMEGASAENSKQIQIAGVPSTKKTSDLDDKKQNNGEDGENKSKGFGGFVFSTAAKLIMISLVPIILIIFGIFFLVFCVTSIFTEFDNAFGVSQFNSEETGNFYPGSNKDQEKFYDRINIAKLAYQATGKTIEPLRIVSIFSVLQRYGADLDYDDMDQFTIFRFADAMFSGNSYDEETFRENLITDIIPSYLPNTLDGEREDIAQEIIDYVDRYYELIGLGNENSCASTGSCSYDIKGFYIQGKGNVAKSMQVKDLYVQLMQCGTGNGHNYGGTFGQPLEGEELVPFEKYILGVAYQEIGPTAPAEAIKAQMVAARSYILARHVDMGGWRTLQEENGKWILKAASCTQDQVYCDPDQGCSSNDGQWGQIHSGLNHNRGFKRDPMPQDSPLRKYAEETAGEVLVNSQGFIIYSGYLQTEQNMFSNLAKQGLNYKQILLQVYNQGSRNYGAADILKGNCNMSGSANCPTTSSGEFATWKQYEGPWINVPMGNSGKTIRQIGCLATSVSILVAKSGVDTVINDFNPGTFVEFLNKNGGFVSGGNFVWGSVSKAAPKFKFVGKVPLAGLSKEQKLKQIKNIINQKGVYAVAEVKGNTGQHWVAIDSVNGNTVNMMDPGSSSTDMWAQYNWGNTSELAYFKVE